MAIVSERDAAVRVAGILRGDAATVRRMLKRLDDKRLRKLMTERYIKKRNWPDVQRICGYKTRNGTHRAHRRAFEFLCRL